MIARRVGFLCFFVLAGGVSDIHDFLLRKIVVYMTRTNCKQNFQKVKKKNGTCHLFVIKKNYTQIEKYGKTRLLLKIRKSHGKCKITDSRARIS